MNGSPLKAGLKKEKEKPKVEVSLVRQNSMKKQIMHEEKESFFTLITKGDIALFIDNCLIIKQDNWVYIIYNLIQAVICIFSSFMYAYIAAFGITNHTYGEFNHLNMYDIIFTIVFAFDIMLRFVIAYEDVNKK